MFSIWPKSIREGEFRSSGFLQFFTRTSQFPNNTLLIHPKITILSKASYHTWHVFYMPSFNTIRAGSWCRHSKRKWPGDKVTGNYFAKRFAEKAKSIKFALFTLPCRAEIAITSQSWPARKLNYDFDDLWTFVARNFRKGLHTFCANFMRLESGKLFHPTNFFTFKMYETGGSIPQCCRKMAIIIKK